MSVFDFLRNFFTSSPKPRIADEDRRLIMQKWQEIENLMRLYKPSAFTKAVIEADKLLAYVLEKMNYTGSLGDKLKVSKDIFSPETYNDLWEAHKTRNALVHELNIEISSFRAQKAINNFRRGLRELGVL